MDGQRLARGPSDRGNYSGIHIVSQQYGISLFFPGYRLGCRRFLVLWPNPCRVQVMFLMVVVLVLGLATGMGYYVTLEKLGRHVLRFHPELDMRGDMPARTRLFTGSHASAVAYTLERRGSLPELEDPYVQQCWRFLIGFKLAFYLFSGLMFVLVWLFA